MYNVYRLFRNIHDWVTVERNTRKKRHKGPVRPEETIKVYPVSETYTTTRIDVVRRRVKTGKLVVSRMSFVQFKEVLRKER